MAGFLFARTRTRVAVRRKSIFDAQRTRAGDRARDDAIGLEFAQLLSKNFLFCFRDFSAQLAKTA